MFYNIDAIEEQIQKLKKDFEEKSSSNLKEALKKINTDADYKWFFFTRNAIEILALLKTNVSTIIDNGGVDSEKDFKPSQLDYKGFEYFPERDDYAHINLIMQRVIVDDRENTAEFMQIKGDADNYSISYRYNLHETFLDILKSIGNIERIERMIEVHCSECRYRVICENDLYKCVYDSNGEAKGGK